MTANAFSSIMNEALEYKVIRKSIEKSSKVTNEFIETTF